MRRKGRAARPVRNFGVIPKVVVYEGVGWNWVVYMRRARARAGEGAKGGTCLEASREAGRRWGPRRTRRRSPRRGDVPRRGRLAPSRPSAPTGRASASARRTRRTCRRTARRRAPAVARRPAVGLGVVVVEAAAAIPTAAGADDDGQQFPALRRGVPRAAEQAAARARLPPPGDAPQAHARAAAAAAAAAPGARGSQFEAEAEYMRWGELFNVSALNKLHPAVELEDFCSAAAVHHRRSTC